MGGSALFANFRTKPFEPKVNKNTTSLRMKQIKKNAILLSMALATGLLCPMTIIAQQDYDGSRGLFMRGTNVENNSRNGSIGLGGATQENPTDVPLGSGIMVLVAAGIGYVAIKRKEGEK